MYRLGFFAVTIVLVATTKPACAQAGTEGPLIAPDNVPHASAAEAAKKVRHKKLAHRHPSGGAQDAITFDGAGAPHALVLPGQGASADPLSFGLKWNGSSDNARETRVQNYNAAAPGSGAEVGMKLHF